MKKNFEIPHSENPDVEYYTIYPKTPQKRAGNPNFRLHMRAPKGTPTGNGDVNSGCQCARDHFRLRMHTRSHPVAPPPRTTSANTTLSVPIYY